MKCSICNKPITQKQSREVRKIVEAGKVVKVENRHTDCVLIAPIEPVTREAVESALDDSWALSVMRGEHA